MQYMRAFKFVFDSKNWMMNLMWGSLCILSTSIIPIIGQVVFIGYLYELVVFMHRRRSDAEYPDFTFDKFVPYLVRGLWVFLVQLIISIPIIILVIVFYAAFFGTMIASEGKPDPVVLWTIIGVFFVVMLVIGILIGFVAVPLALRAGLMQEFKASFSKEFVKDFLGKMWKQVLLAQLFLMVTSIPLLIIGMAFCCIGMYPAAALLTFAQVHLHYQLYELYLERGGMEIPIKAEKQPPPSDPEEPNTAITR